MNMAKPNRMALDAENARADGAIGLAKQYALGGGKPKTEGAPALTRAEAAKTLGVTVDVFRNWERNGLVRAQWTPGGKPRYGPGEMGRLKIIRVLHGAHYSTMAILRMLTRLDEGELDVEQTIDTPADGEDIIRAADRNITALPGAAADARHMLRIIRRMQHNKSEK